jgi:SAM-dependent methyltransferase|uniref:Methyltransferase domain n=1 Tax=Siphoviridae sp. ctHip2 TaxID=2827830 RepID=A0A8S5RVL5_9CAUD|nr:MAG TPA: Methyltransferase domain [Siphoviridae sp. ctHip2]
MENYSSNKDIYIKRMNQTAKSKFAVVEPYLSKGMKILDFGSGISPEFISDVDSSGAEYYAYDISKTVQTELASMGVNVITQEDLTNKKVKFDVIYLSSVFHEIISYLNRQERTETIAMIINNLKSGGYLVIRDWANPNNDSNFKIQTVSKQAEEEMNIWIKELKKNSIIDNDCHKLVDGSILTSCTNAYEIIFHTVWGLKSLSRESKEQYNVEESIEKWIYNPWEKELKLQTVYYETDETYLPHLQKYFKSDEVPFETKSIHIFQKNK